MDSGGEEIVLCKDYSIDGFKYAFVKLQIVLCMFLFNFIRNQSFNLFLQLRFSLFLIVEIPLCSFFTNNCGGKENTAFAFLARNDLFNCYADLFRTSVIAVSPAEKRLCRISM